MNKPKTKSLLMVSDKKTKNRGQKLTKMNHTLYRTDDNLVNRNEDELYSEANEAHYYKP